MSKWYKSALVKGILIFLSVAIFESGMGSRI